ncbi:hypothetical protein TWF694_005510 [Orbilia ellipsospora]|uniref:Asteroid domain-containing protein n=1 Tax=Orbilia ellipsospora TaxID=2528407 RepID=A0AAV9WUE3_9PEZI
MGISHLLPTLEKLSRPITASFPQDGTHRPTAVIDGSALAHHALSRYLRTLSKQNLTPSLVGFDYDAYGRSVVAWLDAISVGFEIIAICTDAHLPSYKTPTRLSRMQNTVNGLSRLRTLSTSLVDTSRLVNWTPTFLIAAFCDAIKRHGRWSDVLKSVPGEADAFCAAAAFSHPTVSTSSTGAESERVEVVIFTSDSDLMVYPTNPTTRIAFFNDIVFEHTLANGSTVKLSLWNPYDIDRKLGSTDTERRMVKFAWCLLTDSIKARSIISGKPSNPNKIIVPPEFQEQYTLPSSSLTTQELPLIYDSRAGEVVYSSTLYSSLAHPPIPTGEQEVTIYLPVLLEDTTRPSAWNIGRRTRVAAYRLLYTRDTTIIEIHRKAAGVGRTAISPSDEQYDVGLSEYIDSPFINTPDQAENETINPLLINLILEIISDYDNRNTPLSQVDMIALIAAITRYPENAREEGSGRVHVNLWTWFRAHLWAQVMAGLWSLYLLHTTLSLPLVDATALVGSEKDGHGFEKGKKQWEPVGGLVGVIDAGRFMAVYSHMPEQRQKGGKKGRKRAKLDSGVNGGVDEVVRGAVGKIFGDVGWKVVQEVLGVVEERRRERERQQEEEEPEGEMFMGMTVG